MRIIDLNKIKKQRLLWLRYFESEKSIPEYLIYPIEVEYLTDGESAAWFLTAQVYDELNLDADPKIRSFKLELIEGIRADSRVELE